MRKILLLSLLIIFTAGSGLQAQDSLVSFKEGKEMFGQNRFPEAAQYFSMSLEQNSHFADAYYFRGKCHLFQYQPQEALKDYKKAEAENLNISLKPTLYADMGMAYNQMKENKKALSFFDKAIKLKPDFALAYNNRGIAYQNLGNIRAAISDYSNAIKLDSGFALAYSNRGSATYYDQDIAEAHKLDIESAVSDFNKALKIDPNLCVAMRNRGLCYSFLKKYDLAVADISKAISCEPNNPANYISRGVIRYKQQAYDQAVGDFMHAINLSPGLAEAYCEMGLAKMRMNYIDEAIKDEQTAIGLDKQYKAWAYFNIASAHALQNNKAESLKYLQWSEKAGYFRQKKNLEDFFECTDFQSLAKDKDFKKFADRLKAKGPAYFR